MPQCAGMSLDEDERLRSDAEVECSSGASRPGADYLRETKTGTVCPAVRLVRWGRRMPRDDV
jgi:hypothetical protein